MAPKITVNLSGINSTRGRFQAVLDKQLHLEASQPLTLADIARAQRGYEALGRALKTHPQIFIELLASARPEGIRRLRRFVSNLAHRIDIGPGSEGDGPDDPGPGDPGPGTGPDLPGDPIDPILTIAPIFTRDGSDDDDDDDDDIDWGEVAFIGIMILSL